MNKLFAKQWLYNLKMSERSNLNQHVNVFNDIITDQVRLVVKIDNEDKKIILFFSLLDSYDHLMITLTYMKYTINLEVITATFLSHSQMRQSV